MSSPTLPAARSARTERRPDDRRTPVVEIVVPVHDEQAALPGSIRRRHDHLSNGFPFGWRIVVADNASSDATADVARALADDLDGVSLLDLPEKGRGRALRAAWSGSDADVLCYMDVDLSTDLAALLPLVAPLVSGRGERRARGCHRRDGRRRVRREAGHERRRPLRPAGPRERPARRGLRRGPPPSRRVARGGRVRDPAAAASRPTDRAPPRTGTRRPMYTNSRRNRYPGDTVTWR
jgi:hypothetical protein